MNWLRISGAVQISLLLTMITVAGNTWAMTVVAVIFCALLVGTWTILSSSRMAYDGWFSSFLVDVTYYGAPLGALLYVLLGPAFLPMWVVAAFAFQVERFRERQTAERQLGWAAFPLLSLSIALWLQFGDLRIVTFESLSVMALVCTCITTLRISDPAVVVANEDPVVHDIVAEPTTERRSYKHAA